jgi:hypothetical protein
MQFHIAKLLFLKGSWVFSSQNGQIFLQITAQLFNHGTPNSLMLTTENLALIDLVSLPIYGHDQDFGPNLSGSWSCQ